MSAGRIHPPVIPPQDRIKGFDPYVANLNDRTALYESTRCFMCFDAPCISGCPTRINIPEFIYRIKTGNYRGAAKVIRESNVFGGECGYVCPVERLCEVRCIRNNLNDEPVAIGLLQRFAYEKEKQKGLVKFDQAKRKNKKVAVVGAGPSGMSAAYELALKGYDVTVFDANPAPGGLLLYGILPWKVAWSVPENEVRNILEYGVEFTHKRVNDLSPLLKEYAAVFIGIGSTVCARCRIAGEDLPGVFLAEDFLCSVAKSIKGECKAPDLKGKRVAVVGGGDTALDAACASIRLGAAKVFLLYRRSVKEMPSVAYSRNQAREEGVEFMFLTAPTKVKGGKKVEGMECVRMELGPKDASGRSGIKPMEGSDFTLDVECVIMAVGQEPDQGTLKSFGVAVKNGLVKVDDNYATSLKGVFAGGDAVNGGDTVVEAAAEGKKAAAAIDKYLSGGK